MKERNKKITEKSSKERIRFLVKNLKFPVDFYIMYGIIKCIDNVLNNGALMKKILFLLLFLMLFLTGCGFNAENVIFEDAEFIYDGTEKSIFCKSKIPENINLIYENNSATEAGSYTTTLSIYNKDGELLSEKNATLTIKKATYDMSSVIFESKEVSYNGKEHSISISSPLPEGVSVSYSQNSYKNAGTYTVTAYFSGDEKNYETIPSTSAVLTILPIEPNPTFTLQNSFLHSASIPDLKSDIEGKVVFGDNQSLVPGTNIYYFDFYPTSTNYKTKFDIPILLTVKSSVNYISDNYSVVEYVDCGKTVKSVSLSTYEKDNYLNIFSHWSKTPDGAPFDFSSPVYSDLSLYGVFKTEEKKYVNLHHSTSKVERFGYYSYLFPTKLPEINDSLFLGWYKEPSYYAEKVDTLSDVSIVDLYAMYVPKVILNENEKLWAPAKDDSPKTTATENLLTSVLNDIHIQFIKNHSLSTDDYFCYLKNLNDKHLFITEGNAEYEIYHSEYSSSIQHPNVENVTVFGDETKGLIVAVKRDIMARDLGILICLDAGHGGKDPGAVSGQIYESDIALSVIELLSEKCERQGFSVLLTRSSDTFVELADRCKIANRANADIFVSVHCNSATNSIANGTEVYYAYGAKSQLLAYSVYSKMISAVPLASRGVKTQNYTVIKDTNMPAILCELAFISNKSDLLVLTDPDSQEKWAEAICKGICSYYGVPYLEFE